MTNRELLELVAKVVGESRTRYIDDPIFGVGMIGEEPDCGIWNPLTNDGDAFRLAVKLDIAILPGSRAQIGFPYGPIFGEDSLIYGSTRRAIVRAAAEIGRAKQ